MNLPSQEEIQSRFGELPEDVKRAIQSADMAAALEEVGAAHGFHIDQLGALEDEALLVMLGFSNPADFPERVAGALHVDANTAAAVAGELSEKLFVPIRDSMRSFMEARAAKAETVRHPAAVESAPAAMRTAPPAIAPAPGGGKTIMPQIVQPVPHPIDRALSETRIVLPTTTDLSPAPEASPAPAAAPAASQNTPAQKPAVDPYREPIE
ncbi:MAG: hypothetical protein ACREGH_01425 [Minisyncoccia bacterium]